MELIGFIFFSDTDPISIAFSEFWLLSSLITLIYLEVLLVTILDVFSEVWGVSGMILSKLPILFSNSLWLSPTPSIKDLVFLSSLIFRLALSLTLKGLNIGFSMGMLDEASSTDFYLGTTLALMVSLKTCKYLLV